MKSKEKKGEKLIEKKKRGKNYLFNIRSKKKGMGGCTLPLRSPTIERKDRPMLPGFPW